MWRKLLCLALILTLVCSALPMTALADTFEELVAQSRLSAAELSRAQALIAMDDSAAHWENGQIITASSSTRQTEEYLEFLLNQQIEGLLLSVQDINSLTDENAVLDQVYSETLNLHNEVDYYQQVLEDGRSALQQQLNNLNQGTLVEQYRHNQRVRETMQALEEAIQHVSAAFASNSDSYEDRLASLTAQFESAKPDNASLAQANLGDANAQNAVSQLLSTSALLTEQEQNQINGDKEFTIKVLQSHLFAFEILDTNDQPISGAKVTVSSSANQKGEGITDAKGWVSFLVSSFGPDESNTVSVNIIIEKAGYGVREAEGLHIKGGNFIPFRLASATGDTYLRMASFNGMDVLSQQETVYYTPQNNEQLSFDVKAVTPTGKGDLTLCYQTEKDDGTLVDHTVKKSFVNGEKVSFTDKWLQKLAPCGKISLKLEADKKTYPFDISLRVERAVVDSPVTKSDQAFRFLGEEFTFTFPKSIPFIGGDTMSLTMPVPKVNVLIEPSGHILLAYGKNYTDEIDRWKKEKNWQSQARYDEAAREGERDANAVENGVYEGSPVVKTRFLGTAAATFTPLAVFQGTLGFKPGSVTDKAFSLSGYGGVQGLFDADFTATAWVMGFPLFLCLNITFALGTAAALDMQWDWDGKNLSNLSLSKGSSWIIDFMTELGISIGVGIKNLLSAAVRFYGRLSSSLKLWVPSSASVKLTLGITVVIQVLVLKYTHPLYEGTFLDSSISSNSTSTNAVQESPTVLGLSGAPGINIVDPSPVEPVANDPTGGLKAVHTTQLAKQLESVAQDVQYVTLTCPTKSGETKTNTFAFWITPTGKSERTGELIWYNLSEGSKNGKVFLEGRSSKTEREIGTDYSFALMGTEDMVAVTVIGGYFYRDLDLEACSADVAIMQMDESGQLSIIDYELIQHIQTITGEGILSQPMVFLWRRGSDPQAYTALAGCAGIRSANDQSASRAYFKQLIRNSKTDYTHSATVVDDFSDNEHMSTFVMATPNNMTFDGKYISDPNYVTRCYYCLGQDPKALSNEEAAENGEAYQANLYLYLNGKHKLIDTDVSYIAPLANVTDISGAGEDGKDYLFYLKHTTESDGSKSYLLKNVCLERSATLTVTDHGITVPTGRFNTSVVPKKNIVSGDTYANPYLYWLEYATMATGDSASADTSDAYRLKAVTFDRKANIAYGPYTLTELQINTDEKPNTVYVKPQLEYADDSDEQGFFRIYYTCEQEEATNDALDARIRQKLYQAKAVLAVGAEFTGIAMKDPCVSPGKHATLLFSLKNTGNLPISGVLVQVLLNNAVVGNVMVSCNNPTNSANSFFTDSAYTITRVPNVFDNHNNDFWVQEVQTTDLANGGVQNATTVQTTRLLMPSGVHTYKASMMIPDTWSGAVTLTARIKNIYFQHDINNGLANLTANAPASFTLDGVYMVDENGQVSSVSNDTDEPAIQTVRVGSADSTKKTLGEGRGDLGLFCQVYKADNGKQFVRVNIVGRSTTNSSVRPTLTALRDDGVQVMHHTFANHIDEDYSYTLDIPASYLLKDAENGYITFSLLDNESENAASAEFSSYDNQRTVWLGELAPLHIVQHPASVETMAETNAAFTVAAADGKAPYAYQWQRQNADGDWENVADANNAQLTLTAVGVADNGAQFRCIVGDFYGNTVTSNPAMLTVIAPPPLTGDSAQPLLWMVMALTALLAAAWFVTKRRRNA